MKIKYIIKALEKADPETEVDGEFSVEAWGSTMRTTFDFNTLAKLPLPEAE